MNNNIIEYKKSEFLNLLLKHKDLIDNLFIFESNDSYVYYKGECQFVEGEYKFCFPEVDWKIIHNSDILSVIDNIKANNQTLLIQDFNNANELLENVFDTFECCNIPTKFWIIKNDKNLCNLLWKTLNRGQYFTIIL